MEIVKACNVCESSDIQVLDERNSMSECRTCAYIFDNPRPSTQEIAHFYSKGNKYDFWISEEKARLGFWTHRFLKIKNYLSQGSLLDVGAGIGEFLHIAQKHFQVRGTEVSESAIAIAKEKYGIRLEKGELEHIDFKGATFDVITLFHVLEHVPSPLETIKKCKSLLNENGLLIIAVPNDLHSLESRIRSLLSFLRVGRWKNRGIFGLPKITLDGTMDEIHLSHFTVPVLKHLLNTCGFEIVDDSLDPFYPVQPKRKFIDDSRYALFLLLKKMFGKNWYPTIWMAATLRKT